MLYELDENFTFSKMKKDDLKYAFTFWLQNVTNMPISLLDQNTKEYCTRLGLRAEEFMEVADKLDINLAVIDDMINNLQTLNNSQDYEVNPDTNSSE